MISQFIALVFFPLLLAVAAGWDLASYTIPNLVQVGLALTFLIFAVACGMAPAAVGFHLLAGAAALAAGFALFAFGVIGGGDAKLYACVVLFFGPHDVLVYTLAASLLGGALSIALMTLRQFPLPAVLAGQDWILRLHEPDAGVPYGVALAAGAVAVLPHSELFRIAAGS